MNYNDQLSVLAKNLDRNEAMWKKWVEYGVKPDTMLEVDFFFTTNSQSAKDALLKQFEGTSMNVSAGETRRHLIFKSYYIQITLPKEIWTLEKLNAKTVEFFHLGLKTSQDLILDGNGATMP